MSIVVDMECFPQIKRRCLQSTFKMDLIDAKIVLQSSPALDPPNQLQMGPIRWDMVVPELKQPIPRLLPPATMEQLRFSVAVLPDLSPLPTTFREQEPMEIPPYGILSAPVSNISATDLFAIFFCIGDSRIPY